ncbi:pyridoxal phosphate-dependent decarboxylase family protein [Salsipaludibacter albus]|uniref:pyridoxal phosphate-dependent decarboxylase family protein n=1 Tax=Salsipaludibacter albus TaxID=2849650 RepID=UPI001EE4CA1E|nr:pyridoxal-dependent decarboxylase [Salsipaludibacter albus]MBY5164497.1 aspartate aminotransferase family protein [Salsipaludibacter albus]
MHARELGVSRPPPVDDLDWAPDRAAALGHDAVDLWEEFLERLPDLPIHRGRPTDEVAAAMAWTVPDAPDDPAGLMADTRDLVMEWSMYPGNGGFLGYVSGAGTVPGAPADLLAAALNNNLGGWRLSPGLTELEQRLLRWFADRFGLPASAGGYLTSGGSAANHDALVVARDVKAGWDVRRDGLRGGPPLRVYAPDTAHDTIQRGADLVGLGTQAVRSIRTDGTDHVDVAAMRRSIIDDLAAGDRPIALVGSAGTIGTGAIDDLEALADLADQFDLWFHVDGAIGAVGALADQLAPRFGGLSRADSIGLDPHKWLYVPIACGMLLVRDTTHLASSFHIDPTYTTEDKVRMGAGVDAYVLSPFFTRHAAALKMWWSLRAHGWDAYARRLVQDCVLAGYLHDLAVAHPRLEATSEPDLMIATFRYVPEDGRGPDAVDELNQQIMERLQYSGRVYPSNAVIDDRFVLRACIVNFRTEATHVESLVDLAVAAGDDLAR